LVFTSKKESQPPPTTYTNPPTPTGRGEDHLLPRPNLRKLYKAPSKSSFWDSMKRITATIMVCVLILAMTSSIASALVNKEALRQDMRNFRLPKERHFSYQVVSYAGEGWVPFESWPSITGSLWDTNWTDGNILSVWGSPDNTGVVLNYTVPDNIMELKFRTNASYWAYSYVNGEIPYQGGTISIYDWKESSWYTIMNTEHTGSNIFSNQTWSASKDTNSPPVKDLVSDGKISIFYNTNGTEKSPDQYIEIDESIIITVHETSLKLPPHMKRTFKE